ncbi:GntR family transcriptional regulator [Enterocloster sp. OA13]|uniref:GntR family transcriptional regulator n=1 Tax=Enterocloster TaxID=2719313 RepID=UPI0004AE06D5|nr:GntR family transcriptional regulator [Lachnoclostridium pacaense]MCC2877627.1 GntR family transcriptional regulator [Lachnoclostridium pacaense]MCH1950006.1 GntR family transcriptional regulator [Enterocloster sp. OA13]
MKEKSKEGSQGRSDYIYEELKNEIINLRLHFGAPLVEEELAQKYEVSRTPVRQALRRLENENFVVIMPYRGCFVRQLSENDIDEIYTVRAVLEGYCVNCATRIINQDNLKVIEEDINRGMEKCQQGDGQEFGQEGQKLHQISIEIGGNRRIRQILKNISEQNQWLHNYSINVPGRFRQSCEEHLRILEAMKAGDAGQAEELMRKHLFSTMEDVKKSFINSGLKYY